jgi:cell division protein FtsN
MAKDYSKPASASRNGGGSDRPMNPMFLGIIIGLLLGIVIALGVALWLNKSAIPFFMERAKPLEPPPKLESKAQPKAEPKAEPPKTAETAPPKTAPEKSRFEFYQILPGEKDAGKAVKPAIKKPAESQPVEKPAAAAREAYFLQAGAFQNESDADNMKVKIAFIGLAASVKAVTLADKGTLYRVRLGPYQSLEEVNRIKSALSDNGVGAAIVKTSDTIN